MNDKEEKDIKKTKRKITILFILGIIITVVPILFVWYCATHITVIYPT